MNKRLRGAPAFVLALAVWEVVSKFGWLTSAIPAPSTIAMGVLADRGDYYPHVEATLASASIGFVLGNLLAAIVAVFLAFLPGLRLATGILKLLYSIPLILLVPIIGMVFNPSSTKVLCAILLVYYPTLVITGLSLGQTPSSLADVLYGMGGDKYTVFVKLRIRIALAGFAAGLRTAAPFALLGAMLGELTGARWGLGTYLIAVMAQGNPVKLWGVFTVCSAIAALAYFAVGVATQPFVRHLDSGRTNPINSHRAPEVIVRIRSFLISLLVTLVIWEFCVRVIDVEYFVKGPLELLKFASRMPADQWHDFFAALSSSLIYALVGLVAGLAVAFLLAVVCDFAPHVGDALLPFAIISQAVPIVALIPLYVAILGRGSMNVVAVVVSATFFSSFVSINEGLRQVPSRLIDVARASGASRIWVFTSVSLPASLPFVFAAAQLAAPRVLLGVTLAEYLATRTGLGALMFEARGNTDFGMMWLIAVTAGVASLCLTALVDALAEAFGRKSSDESSLLV